MREKLTRINTTRPRRGKGRRTPAQMDDNLPGLENLPHEGVALPMLQRTVLRIQRQQGNQAARQFLAKRGRWNMIQRVPVRENRVRSEILSNQMDPATGQFTQNEYQVSAVNDFNEGANINYDMTRSDGPPKVVVTVRIKFVSQWGERGWIFDSPPQPVPAAMHPFIRTVCNDLVDTWNTANRFELLGRPEVFSAVPTGVTPTGGTAATAVAAAGGPAGGTLTAGSTPAGTAVANPSAAGPATTAVGGPGPTASSPMTHADEIHLPVEFRAVPVLDVSADAHTTVLFDSSTAAGSTNTAVIDSAHWFRNRDAGVYPASDASIYAHEFGHMLGIQDEYSLSNPEAHNILHQISPNPSTRATMDALLDQAGLREVILSALRPELEARVAGLGTQAAAAFTEQQNAMEQNLGAGLRRAWASPEVLDAAEVDLRADLAGAGGQERALNELRRVLEFEATQNLSEATIARRVVPQELDPARIQQIITAQMLQVTSSLQRPTFDIPYTTESGQTAANNITVELASGVGAAGSPLRAAAQQAAQAGIGAPTVAAPAAGGPAAGRTPTLYPSNTLIGRLTALPGRWRNMRQAMDTQLSELPDEIGFAVDAQLAANPLSGQVNNNIRQLYQALYRLVDNAATAAAVMTLRNFLTDEISSEIRGQVDDIMAAVEGEIAQHHTAVGMGTNAAPSIPPDPQLLASARQMRLEAEALMNPPAGPAPAGGGAAAPVAQNVRFTFNNQMGDNNASNAIRADQVQRIATLFNANSQLRRQGEGEFHIQSS